MLFCIQSTNCRSFNTERLRQIFCMKCGHCAKGDIFGISRELVYLIYANFVFRGHDEDIVFLRVCVNRPSHFFVLRLKGVNCGFRLTLTHTLA